MVCRSFNEKDTLNSMKERKRITVLSQWRAIILPIIHFIDYYEYSKLCIQSVILCTWKAIKIKIQNMLSIVCNHWICIYCSLKFVLLHVKSDKKICKMETDKLETLCDVGTSGYILYVVAHEIQIACLANSRACFKELPKVSLTLHFPQLFNSFYDL